MMSKQPCLPGFFRSIIFSKYIILTRFLRHFLGVVITRKECYAASALITARRVVRATANYKILRH
jgi:hypothetical protein